MLAMPAGSSLMSTSGMGTSFGGGGLAAALLTGDLGNHARTPISANMARWRSSNSKRVSTFWSSVMLRV
jgi:hypothetical protein